MKPKITRKYDKSQQGGPIKMPLAAPKKRLRQSSGALNKVHLGIDSNASYHD